MRSKRRAGDAVDWSEVRRRMDAAGQGLADVTDVDPERAREILVARAVALACPEASTPEGATLELVTFALAAEVYAVESRFVCAVVRLEDMAPLPGAAPPVSGVTAFRGALLAVLDLRSLLGLSVADLNDLSRLIVIGATRPEFGVLADAVLDMVTIRAADVRGPVDGSATTREYLKGITADATLVLDGERLLRL